MSNYPRLVVAGIKGGSGKTTLSLGLTAAFKRRKGLRVIPFKKGPDYIDAGWMSLAAHNPCYNLDPFLISREKVLESFIAHFHGDIAVIEGNRGLYDGMDAEGSYSTAELAKLLRSPVILIVDCTKMTRTTAAIVLGCMEMDRAVAIKGIVLNQVSGSRHESVVRASIEKYCSLPVLGAIPRLKDGEFPERHMGLTPYHEHPATEQAISFVEQTAGEYLDLDRILDIANGAEPLEDSNKSPVTSNELNEKKGSDPLLVTDVTRHSSLKIGVIRDTAFQFYYPENLEELESRGAGIIDINALSDTALPDIDALYIGGGFPETNALKLAENASFRNSVRAMVERGLPVYAECGGLMFLGESIIVEGRKHPMVGVFPITFEMKEKPQAHGYTIVEIERENPFYPVGTVLHGHEFHYSAVVSMEEAESIHMAFGMKRGQGIRSKRDGMCYKNVLATYTHVHVLGARDWAAGLINRALEFKEGPHGRFSWKRS